MENGVLASAGERDETLRFWDVEQRVEAHRVDEPHAPGAGEGDAAAAPAAVVRSTPIRAAARGRGEHRDLLATVATDPVVRVWRVERCLPGAAVSVDASSKRGSKGAADLKPEDLVTVGAPCLERRLVGHAADVSAAEFCAFAGAWLTLADDGVLIAWDAVTGSAIRTLTVGGDPVVASATDEVNRILLAASADKTVRAFSLARVFEEEANPPLDAPDPDRTTNASDERSILASYLDASMTFRGHADQIRAVAHLPSKRLYVTAGCDGRAMYWLAADHPLRRAARLSPPGAEDEHPEFAEWARRRGGAPSAYEREHPCDAPEALKKSDPVATMLAREAERRDPAREAAEAAERERARAEARAEREARTELGRRLAKIEKALSEAVSVRAGA